MADEQKPEVSPGPLAGREWCGFCARETPTHLTVGQHGRVCLYCGSQRPPQCTAGVSPALCGQDAGETPAVQPRTGNKESETKA